jgi:glycosyltransferase involved in cell wall biosynthesis
MLRPSLKVTIRESTSFEFYKSYSSWVSVKFLVLLFRFLYPIADEIIFPSLMMKDIFLREIDLNQFVRFRILPNIVDEVELLKKSMEPIDPKLWHRTRKKVIVNVGRLDRNKNQALIIDAMKLIQDLDVEFIQIGSGAELSFLKAKVENLGLTDRVTFLGYQENPFKFLKAADIFVLSSLVEGYPNVLVQAKFFNLDIVSLDCPTGPAEILSGYSKGCLINLDSMDLADSVAKKLRDLY